MTDTDPTPHSSHSPGRRTPQEMHTAPDTLLLNLNEVAEQLRCTRRSVELRCHRAGVVHQSVQPVDTAGEVVGEVADRGQVGQVAQLAVKVTVGNPLVQGNQGVLEMVRVVAMYVHGRAELSHSRRGRLADAGGRAGD